MRPFLIAMAGALSLSAAASAQDLTTGHVASIDTNGDGAVDAAEFDAFVAAAFPAMDADGDGFVSEAESTTFMSPEQFAGADANGDGGLSRDEFAAQAQADFAAADQDGDGVLN